MTEKWLTFSDEQTLLALHRLIIAAKFSESLMDTALSTSPVVARIANDVVEALMSSARTGGGTMDVSDWEEWRFLNPDRREWSVALNRARADNWSELNASDRKERIDLLIAPFKLSEDNYEVFVESALSLQEKHPASQR